MVNGQGGHKDVQRTLHAVDMKYGLILAGQFRISVVENADSVIKDGFVSNTRNNIPRIMCRDKAHNNCFNLAPCNRRYIVLQ